MTSLHIRWLGRTRYRDTYALQQRLSRHSDADWLLLNEHDPVYTLGRNADERHLGAAATDTTADIERVDRGGDVTYHGPGQLVGYPILTLEGHRGGTRPSTPAYVHRIEEVLIDTLGRLGIPDARRRDEYPGVWVTGADGRPAKIAAIGIRLVGNRTLHGFALNVDPDMSMFEHIVPCGIAEFGVTSMAQMGVITTMRRVAETLIEEFAQSWGAPGVDRADVAWKTEGELDLAPFSRRGATGVPRPTQAERRRHQAGVSTAVALRDRKPEFLRARVTHDPEVMALKRTVRDLGLVTVCEEAGCPNLSECWSDGTATFMINGERCTRACGFCLVDTQKPAPPDPGEAHRVAEAVERLGLRHVVITTVARDDLPDGGAAQFVDTMRAIRYRSPDTAIEVLISDCKGDPQALELMFAERPDVLNHNLETVARLQRMARPSASYARSLAVLARAKDAGLTTKSGLVLGMGETKDEIGQALFDLAGVGVDIVTMGQYLRPTADHLPIERYWTPEDFAEFADVAEAAGIGHAESSPFTRSSYHASHAADRVGGVPVGIASAAGR